MFTTQTDSAIEETTRHLLRIGGWAAIIGSVMAGAGNLLHPATPLDDDVGAARLIAESGVWIPVHLLIVFGIILMLGGLVALQRSIPSGLPGALAHLGLAAAVAGIALGVVLVIMDGVAAPVLAKQWVTAPVDEQGTALSILLANQTLDFALASAFNFLFAGVTFILFGLAVAFSYVYPRWLGWVATGAGVASIGAGMIQAFVGEPTVASRILTIIGPTVITAWLLVMGVLQLRLARTGSNEATSAHRSESRG